MNRKLILGGILALALLITFGLFRSIQAEGTPLLWINPANPVINTGETVTVTIQLDQATDVFGVELEMTYDPAIVQIVDADSGTGGVQILPGTCPAPDFVIQNTAYNITGTLNYAVTQFSSPPCNGGNVAQVTFQAIANGTSPFDFTTHLIADTNGMSITHTAQNGLIIVGPTPTPTDTPTETALPTITATPTNTLTPTPTGSATATMTPTPTGTDVPPSATPTPTITQLPPDALLSLQPDNLNISFQSTADLSVMLENISDVYGLHFILDFDPTMLAVVDADLGTDGVQITPGDCPQPDFVATNIASNALGTITYDVTKVNPTIPCDGGQAATIQLQCLAPGASTLITFTESLIATRDGETIPHTTANATIHCVEYLNFLPAIFNPASP